MGEGWGAVWNTTGPYRITHSAAAQLEGRAQQSWSWTLPGALPCAPSYRGLWLRPRMTGFGSPSVLLLARSWVAATGVRTGSAGPGWAHVLGGRLGRQARRGSFGRQAGQVGSAEEGAPHDRVGRGSRGVRAGLDLSGGRPVAEELGALKADARWQPVAAGGGGDGAPFTTYWS